MEQQKQWTIYKGRPLDEQGRSLAELRVYDLLDELGIDYERVDHEAAMTMAACGTLTGFFMFMPVKIFF